MACISFHHCTYCHKDTELNYLPRCVLLYVNLLYVHQKRDDCFLSLYLPSHQGIIPPSHQFNYLSSLFPYCIQNDFTSQLLSLSFGFKKPRPILLRATVVFRNKYTLTIRCIFWISKVWGFSWGTSDPEVDDIPMCHRVSPTFIKLQKLRNLIRYWLWLCHFPYLASFPFFVGQKIVTYVIITILER